MTDEPIEMGTNARSKKGARRTRRNYPAELHALQGRVDTAVRILEKASGGVSDPAADVLFGVALDILKGE
jgi:hypothetical protein